MKFIFGKKIQMSQIFAEDGTLVPVTLVRATPCTVTQIKKKPHDTVNAVQIGFDEDVPRHMSKPQTGHLKNLPLLRTMREVSLEEKELEGVERGDMITIETFKEGDAVDVVGTSKGKGFHGVVRRHHFRGGPATHGHKDNLRMPGSIGAGGVQRVFKGMRMGGHMGDEQVTVKNLSIVGVDLEQHIIKIKGALPGGRNALVFIKGQGTLQVKKIAKEAPVASTPQGIPENAPQPVSTDMSATAHEEIPAATQQIV